MIFDWLKTLRAQTVMAPILAVLLSQGLAGLIHNSERDDAIRQTELEDFLERSIGVFHLVQKLPEQWLDTVVSGASSRNFSVRLLPFDAVGPGPTVEHDETLLGEYGESLLGSLRSEGVKFIIEPRVTGEMMSGSRSDSLGAVAKESSAEVARLAFALDDERWLEISGRIPSRPTSLPFDSIIYIVLLAATITVIAIWLVERATRPLARLALAADRLGRDLNAKPLTLDGPTEVRRAAEAFNLMQDRLKRLIENRTHMLAAISHDLRTPITLMRLRAEFLDDPEHREKLMKNLDEMEAMVEASLDFSAAGIEREEPRLVDLNALVSSLCEDLADHGFPVHLTDAAQSFVISCRLTALRRAFANVLDNAVKYGGNAFVSINDHNSTAVVSIEDDGPGVPTDALETIFLPFRRLEASRNVETGGRGLGLSIAQSIIQAHGGKISAMNRPQGGLRVTIELPRGPELETRASAGVPTRQRAASS